MVDEDLSHMNEGELRAEVQRLRGVIRRNRHRYEDLQVVARREKRERKRLEDVLHRERAEPRRRVEPDANDLLRSLFGGK